MMVGDPIPNPETGKPERGYMIELHSRGGYSGSPVFGFISPKQVQLGGPPRDVLGEIGYLLGVIWGHLRGRVSVLGEDGKPTAQYVRVPRGLAGVVPSMNIDELLRKSRSAEQRDVDERIWLDTHPEDESTVKGCDR